MTRYLALLAVLVFSASPAAALRAGGLEFGDAVPVNSNAASDGEDQDRDPLVLSDGRGAWVVTWRGDPDTHGNFDGDGRTLWSRSTDDGRTWTPVEQFRPGGTDYDFELGDLATDRRGTLVAVVTRSRTIQVFYNLAGMLVVARPELREAFVTRSTDGGVTWTEPQLLSDLPVPPAEGPYPYVRIPGYEGRVAFDGQGFVVLWYRSDLEVAFIVRSTDGATWGEPQATAPGFAPRALVAAGSTLVVEEAERAELGARLRSGDGGVSWSPLTLSGDATASLATDGDGTWLSVGENGPGPIGLPPQRWIVLSTSTDDALTWSPARIIEQGRSGSENPSIATDGSGTWIVVYGSSARVVTLIRSLDGGATWTAPEPLTDTSSDVNPVIAQDGAGRWLAVWQSRTAPGETSGDDYDIVSASGSPATGGGAGSSTTTTTTPSGGVPTTTSTLPCGTVEGASCDDGDPCTVGDQCVAGACTGQTVCSITGLPADGSRVPAKQGIRIVITGERGLSASASLVELAVVPVQALPQAIETGAPLSKAKSGRIARKKRIVLKLKLNKMGTKLLSVDPDGLDVVVRVSIRTPTHQSTIERLVTLLRKK